MFAGDGSSTNYKCKINSPTSGGYVFQQAGTFFKLIHDSIRSNVKTKCYENWAINVTFRVKKSPPPGGHVFQPTRTIFTIVQDIIGTNLLTKVLTRNNAHIISTNVLTKFHEDLAINVIFRPNFLTNPKTIFNLVQDIIETNLLTKFHEHGTKNVASRVLTGKHASLFREDRTINVASMIKNTKPNCGHVIQPTGTIFDQGIIRTNLVTEFHEDRTINVASRVLTRKTVL
ncbi:hypothetical protein DPMN_125282 [Dreissena polymorpha]|uniref:Uncharacterized protein n=1 Tax=Dreissena polymorpha TaxID=45954 RepID=A0A9D4GV08_DREPO|nr:hypothetical protein DPMN_125282 [Dreissena polymorpha]